jgi:hypothetical protein
MLSLSERLALIFGLTCLAVAIVSMLALIDADAEIRRLERIPRFMVLPGGRSGGDPLAGENDATASS